MTWPLLLLKSVGHIGEWNPGVPPGRMEIWLVSFPKGLTAIHTLPVAWNLNEASVFSACLRRGQERSQAPGQSWHHVGTLRKGIFTREGCW